MCGKNPKNIGKVVYRTLIVYSIYRPVGGVGENLFLQDLLSHDPCNNTDSKSNLSEVF